MPAKDLVCIPDERLRRKSKKVKRVDDNVRRLVDDMVETMYANRGIGLAAPQVGVNRRIIVVHAYQDAEEYTSDLIVLINPVITARSVEEEIGEEGCLSIPDIRADVLRACSITIEGLSPDEECIKRDASGLEARVLQHEVDHLDGILFIDYVDAFERHELLKEYEARRAAAERAGPC